MNLIKVFAAFAIVASAVAQSPAIHSGSTVYIEPMDGYETYLAAAIVKKHVPLIVVMDSSKAEFIITSTVAHNVPNTPQVVISNSATATINEGNSGNQAWNQGWASGQAAAAARAARRAALGATNVSISVIDPHSSQIVFASSAAKGGTADQEAKTAEDCAKHLKEFIEKSEKSKK